MGAHAPIFAAPWPPIYEGPLLSSPIKFPALKIRNTCLRFNPGPLGPQRGGSGNRLRFKNFACASPAIGPGTKFAAGTAHRTALRPIRVEQKRQKRSSKTKFCALKFFSLLFVQEK